MAKRKQPQTESPGAALRKEGQMWLDRVKSSLDGEKAWRDDAEKAVTAYTGETSGKTSALGIAYDFNILFSNVETIVPAVINSPPAPDIRRRFADDDPAARVVADILERAIRVQIDDSRLQTEMEAEAQDGFLAGRGVIRIRFESDIVGGETKDEELEVAAEERDPTSGMYDGVGRGGVDDGYLAGGPPTVEVVERGLGDNGGPPLETLANERICFEAVSWRDYAHGPAKRWEDRWWDAFRFCIPREDEAQAFDPRMISDQITDAEKAERVTWNDLTGWEVWDKKKKEVLFVDDAGVVLKRVPDPLGLYGFFCIARPMQPIEVNGRLMPVNPFAVYRKLAEELDETTRRIGILVRAMKVKGWYPGDDAELANMIDKDDNEWVPITNAEMWAQHGGLEGVIAFWPVEKFIQAVRELYIARDQTKQAIYEITGISDIVRGASKSTETFGAQQIKSQWGSLRIQKMQRMLERQARDLFVMMSEIIPTKFSYATLEKMTGIPIIPQPSDPQEVLQQKQAVIELLQQRLSMFYRIDVESDSTVRADLTRQKQEVAEFLQGAASYWQGVGPLVQQGAMPAEAAIEIFAASARMFNLGKSVEDTLEKMISQVKQQAGQPQEEKPDPEMVKAQMAAQSEQAKAQIAGAKAQSDQAQAQIQIQAIQAKSQADIAKVNADLQAKQLDGQITIATTNAKLEADRQTHAQAMQKGELELEKLRAEILKIQVGTAATASAAKMKQEAATQPPPTSITSNQG